MGILYRLVAAIIRPADSSAGPEADRAEVESKVSELQGKREAADTTIAAWQRQTEAALREYPAERRRPNLAEALREARRHVDSPVRDGGTE